MRILSRFRDYYDNALAHAPDERLVLVRTGSTIANAFHRRSNGSVSPVCVEPAHNWMAEIAALAPGHLSFMHKRERWVLSAAWALVGGRLYPFAVLQREVQGMLGQSAAAARPWLSPTPQDTEPVYFHRLCDLVKHLETMGQSFDPQRSRAFSWLRSSRLSWQAYFELQGSERWQSQALACRVPLASWLSLPDELTVGSVRLANLELFRVLHPVQAHQLLSQFLGNLAAPENNTVQVSDTDRIAQHGFDEWSFRRMPEPKPAKKNKAPKSAAPASPAAGAASEGA